MPIKSKSQQRWLFAAEASGELPKGTAKRWVKETRDEGKDLKKLPDKVGSTKLKATIIEGNYAHKANDIKSTSLYPKLQKHLEGLGYQVSRDKGLPYTQPKAGSNVWVGHSRGVDRLRFAPKGVTTIAIGSNMADSVNHPHDVTDFKHLNDFDKLPHKARQAHWDWHDSMGTKITNKLQMNHSKIATVIYEGFQKHAKFGIGSIKTGIGKMFKPRQAAPVPGIVKTPGVPSASMGASKSFKPSASISSGPKNTKY